MQRVHGNFPSIINSQTKIPLSPQVWGSFLTGKEQTIDSWVRSVSGRWRVMSMVPRWIQRAVFNVLNNSLVFVDTRDLDGPTLIDIIPKTVTVDFPFINYDTRASMLRYTIAPSNRATWRNSEEGIQRERLKRIRSALNDNWDLLLAYIPILDGYGHLYYNDPEKIVQRYQRLCVNVNVLLRILKAMDVYTIIVSDHGIDFKGSHSVECFYSLSHDTGFKPTSITDFYEHIKQVVEK